MIKISNNGKLNVIEYIDGPFSKYLAIGLVIVLVIDLVSAIVDSFDSKLNLTMFFTTFIFLLVIVFIFNKKSIDRLENAELFIIYHNQLLVSIVGWPFIAVLTNIQTSTLLFSFVFALSLCCAILIILLLISFFNKSYMRVKTIVNESSIQIEYSVNILLTSKKWVKKIAVDDPPEILVVSKGLKLTENLAPYGEFAFENIGSFIKLCNRNRKFSLYVKEKNFDRTLITESAFSLIAKTYNTEDILQMINTPSEHIKTILYLKKA